MAEEKFILSPELLEMGGVILKYMQKDISPEQEALLRAWVQKSEENKKLFDELQNNDSLVAEMKRYNESIARTERAKLRAVEDTFPKSSKVKRFVWFRYAAAAVLLIMLSGGYFWFLKSKPVNDKQKETVAKVNDDIAPGQFKAKLTLADGSIIVLDSFSNNKLVQQGRTTVYTRDGKLVYEEKGKHNEVLYNTLTTSKGEIFSILMADGSRVWLNSQSTLRYPVAFERQERRVEVTGEAYFEVAHDATKPFHALLNGMDIQVLGTRFNVNGYEDEAAVKTTLLEGKVKVSKGGALTVLSPGQQAKLDKETQKIERLSNTDVDEAVAWRNGYFQFNEADLQTVLRNLARWYDVEVVYEGKIPQREFIGKIPRNSNLSQVLAALETMQVHFKIQGKKIVVSP